MRVRNRPAVRACLHCRREFPPRRKEHRYCHRSCADRHKGVVAKERMAERFWSKVDKRGPNECWEWTASRNWAGYGKFGVSTAHGVEGAHRVSLWLSGRETPKGMHVDHLCRNPPCVNPNHLEVVTHRENLMRGRGPEVTRARHLAKKAAAAEGPRC
jgi:hypothetical protein